MWQTLLGNFFTLTHQNPMILLHIVFQAPDTTTADPWRPLTTSTGEMQDILKQYHGEATGPTPARSSTCRHACGREVLQEKDVTVKFPQPGIVSNANVLTWVGTRFPPHKSLA